MYMNQLPILSIIKNLSYCQNLIIMSIIWWKSVANVFVFNILREKKYQESIKSLKLINSPTYEAYWVTDLPLAGTDKGLKCLNSIHGGVEKFNYDIVL